VIFLGYNLIQKLQKKQVYIDVYASTTTTTSIHDNWQENARSYTAFPVNATQTSDDPFVDGIQYGFSTHITGVTHGSSNALDQQNLDQTNGFAWISEYFGKEVADKKNKLVT
jgi:hypothetical protein